MHTTFGPLHVTLKNTYLRSNGTIVYQRAVPTKLRERYPSGTVKQDLKTKDIILAARKVAQLNQRYEAEWAGLLAAPESSPLALKAHADALLRQFGLQSGVATTDPDAADMFFDRLQGKREQHAAGDPEVYESAAHSEYLSSVEQAALKALQGKQQPLLSDALELHLSIHPQRADVKFVTYQRRAFATLLAVTGDKVMTEFRRSDARAYKDSALMGAKTATVRRRMGAMSAVFATYIREHDLTTPNPFASIAIDREGHDRTQRHPFTKAELAALDVACRAKDDPMRWVLAMLAGTGARLAEIVGLPLSDIVLDEVTPHVVLQVHPWRDIKGAKGIRGIKDRSVPLVGTALWAAHRVKAGAKVGQMFAFPQYTHGDQCKATHASGALNGWLKRLPMPHTCHDLRHTVKDQLRAAHVQCPKDISDAITGHGTKSVGDSYGLGYDLSVKAQWLSKALTIEEQCPAGMSNRTGLTG